MQRRLQRASGSLGPGRRAVPRRLRFPLAGGSNRLPVGPGRATAGARARWLTSRRPRRPRGLETAYRNSAIARRDRSFLPQFGLGLAADWARLQSRPAADGRASPAPGSIVGGLDRRDPVPPSWFRGQYLEPHWSTRLSALRLSALQFIAQCAASTRAASRAAAALRLPPREPASFERMWSPTVIGEYSGA